MYTDLQILLYSPTITLKLWGGRHKNTQDMMILGRDTRTPNFKSVHFTALTSVTQPLNRFTSYALNQLMCPPT